MVKPVNRLRQQATGMQTPPGKTAVKQECNEGLAAGAEDEIGGIGVSTEGHDTGVDANQVSGQQ